jgi:ethanolamine utilization protein EutA (predicted chaperonin)
MNWQLATNHWQLLLRNQHILGLIGPERQVIAAQAEFDGVAQGGTADDFNLHAIAETHFQQPSAKILVAANAHDRAVATDPKLVESAGFHRATVVTAGKVTGFLHG